MVRLGPASSSSKREVVCGDPVKKFENQLLLGLLGKKEEKERAKLEID